MIMFPYFGYDDMIYFSRYSLVNSNNLLEDVFRDLFRFSIGITGSIVTLTILSLTLRFKILKGKLVLFLTTIGSMTFGIYVFQDLLLLLLYPLSKYLNPHYYIANSIISFACIFSLSIILTRFAKRKRWSSIIFLGQINNK